MVGLNNFSKKNVELGMGLVTANWDHHAHTPVAFTYMKVLKIMQPPIWLWKEREKDTHTHTHLFTWMFLKGWMDVTSCDRPGQPIS